MPTVKDIETGFLSNPIVSAVFLIIVLVVVLVVAVHIIRIIMSRSARLPVALEKVVLLVTVPKDIDEKNSSGSNDPKEQLAVAETLYSNLGGIKPEKHSNIIVNAWNNFVFGRADHIGLEIVAQKGLIKFYVVVPRHLQRIVESQIQAQYPKAHFEEVSDYNIFTPNGVVAGSYLTFTKRSIFPIRTYRKLDSDPLNSLTNVLSKLEPHEGAAIQILIRPAGRGWQKSGQSVARKIQHGERASKMMGSSGGA
ncbi:MAG: hypothetical protein ABII24_01440, partial [bacterium]